LLDIKLRDIDWANKRIFINSAKGGKNRFVQLHKLTEKYLLGYLMEWKPKEYLLNGQDSQRYSSSSVQNVVKRISEGKYHPHSYRHAYLTNLIEHENVFAAQNMAGHESPNSTLFYYHISPDKLIGMYNPLDRVAS